MMVCYSGISCLDGFCRGSGFAAMSVVPPSLHEVHLGNVTILSSNVKKGREKCCPFLKSSEELSNSHASVLTLPFCCSCFKLSVHQSGCQHISWKLRHDCELTKYDQQTSHHSDYQQKKNTRNHWNSVKT